MKKYLSLSETLKKGVPIRSYLASRESRPPYNNNEIFVFATCGRKLYRHHVGYEQHTKFTCSYSPYKWGSRQPLRRVWTTYKIYILSVSYWTTVPESTLANCWQMLAWNWLSKSLYLLLFVFLYHWKVGIIKVYARE